MCPVVFKPYNAAYTHKFHAYSATAIIKIQLNIINMLSMKKCNLYII